MFRVTILFAALAVALPLPSLADEPARAAGGTRNGGHQIAQASAAKSRAEPARARDASCPLGLAEKQPGCVPPGLAAKQTSIIGRVLSRQSVHVVTRPGLYGLGIPPHGSRYGVVDGRLIRFDSKTWRVQSIIRQINAIVD